MNFTKMSLRKNRCSHFNRKFEEVLGKSDRLNWDSDNVMYGEPVQCTLLLYKQLHIIYHNNTPNRIRVSRIT